MSLAQPDNSNYHEFGNEYCVQSAALESAFYGNEIKYSTNSDDCIRALSRSKGYSSNNRITIEQSSIPISIFYSTVNVKTELEKVIIFWFLDYLFLFVMHCLD